MAPIHLQITTSSRLLRVPSPTSDSFLSSPVYSSPTLSPTLSSPSITVVDTFDTLSPEQLSPRTLYAQSFDRPTSARSLPSGRFRKNMKDITGYCTTEEEFDALPIAVRRKYFSTLERLRFAQNSRNTALNELPIQTHRSNSLANRRGVTLGLIEPRRKPSLARRKHKVRQQSISSNEASWFLTLPEKIKKKQFTREEQVVLAANLRESVILDAADEAVYKASRRDNSQLPPILDLSSPTTFNSASMASSKDFKEEAPSSSYAAEMYESFRWMDEEEDLNLKLTLDDYHANLDGVVVPTPASIRRPSFRRQMSITKIPFGRASFSSNLPRSPTIFESSESHLRHKPRTLSLISPKHMPKDSVISIDPNAAHYQDPEARLKLRVYLASPQKFDEAIEFGFPSMDGVAESGADKENRPPKRTSKEVSAVKKSFSTEKSFLNDDAGSLFDDDVSLVDPESPLTPLGELGFRSQRATTSTSKTGKTSEDFSHLGIMRPAVVKQPESYAQAMAGNREMTLRMTLTRPDLRADESAIYGWQNPSAKVLKEEPLPLLEEKSEIKGPFGGLDGWGPDEKENGVVKRFWNKVKSTQRKTL